MLSKLKSKSSSKRSSVAELIADHTGNKAIVFGLQWRSVATSGGRDSAAKFARSARASHFIYRGQQIGFGTIPGRAKDLPPNIYPAALLAARQHAGDSLYVVRIDSGAYWLALIRNGSPTSTDRFVEGVDDAGVLAMARDIFEPLLEDGIKLGIFTNIERSGIDEARLASVEELLDLAMMEDDRLQVVPAGGIKIPKPVLGVLALAVLFLVAQRGYAMWKDAERAKIAAQNVVVEEDPVVAWDRSIEKWSQGVTGHNPTGLALVRDSMADLPTVWDGWILSRSSCTQQSEAAASAPTADGSVAPAKTAWSCMASYERQPGGSLTREMVTKVPPRWTVSFTPLNLMQLSWSVDSPRDPMVIESLPKKGHHNIETVSKLQRLSPVLAQVPSFAFSPVDIPPPVSSSGVAFPPDDRASGIVKADLSVRGPLRSIDALLNSGIDVAWNSLTLSYAPAGSQAGIQSSVITAEAVGVMYAKN